MTPLTILSVAFPLARVSPDSAGGSEQVLASVDAQLHKAGHRSIVIAPEGSCVTGELVPVPALSGTIGDATWHLAHESCRRQIARTLRSERVDVVHLHGLDFLSYVPDAVPAVATLHMPIAWYSPSLDGLDGLTLTLRCVSSSQRRTLTNTTAPVDVIHNGIPVERFQRRDIRPRHHAVVIGRICPEKGVHLAIDAAMIADVPLFIAGETFPFEGHLRYFREQVGRRLSRRCRFIGRIGPRRKARLLGSARCLLVPSLAPETSSLVAMEALACGTPVIAFDSGALPEIVEDGVTGFIVQSTAEMAGAIREVDRIDRARCRAEAVARFSASRMVYEYIQLYYALAHIPRA